MSRRDINNQDPKTLEASLEQYRAAACAEADAVFDDRALEQQRHKILTKLAQLGHSARVIRFPKSAAGDIPAPAINRRWITVAAAAGLIIGLLGGQLVHLVPQQDARRLPPMATSIAPSAPSPSPFQQISAPVDDGFLDEIEFAMQMRGSAELHALDELTPLSGQ
jgi:hypothetical protein